MSAYSSLKLVANSGVRKPSKEEVFQLFMEVGVIELARSQNDFHNLADDLIALFAGHEARQTNERFFTPDSISFSPEIQILDYEGGFRGPRFRCQYSRLRRLPSAHPTPI